MRYEPHPDPPQQQQHPPPSSFPSTHFRHTPSPIHHPSHATSRSRSRSRPPSGGASTSTGPGPARTTRTRRNNSVSSTSPPPHGGPRPQAIVIPGTHTHHRMAASLGGGLGNGNGQGWFMNSHSSASDFSLPTPDSLHSHAHTLHSHSHSHSHQGYTPFSLNSPTADMHLPPLSHSLSHGAHGIPLGGAGNVPKEPTHGHHLSLSSSIGSNGTIVNGINGLGLGMSPPHTHSALLGGTPQSQGAPQGVNVVSQVQTAAEKQAAIANEKRRRRRESHNAVERRRRDNINERISELATLIPECMLDVGNANGTPNLDDQLLSPISPVDVLPGLKKEDDNTSPTSTTPGGTGEVGVVKANKGMIKEYLQQLVTAQGARNRELELELKAYRSGGSGNDMVLASEASVSASSSTTTVPTFSGLTLPPTNEDDELMDMEPSSAHLHQFENEQRGGSEESGSSPAGSIDDAVVTATAATALEAERGRTRDVVSGRRGGLGGNGEGGLLGLGMGAATLVAMET
ncbi:hypothetical protein AN958_12438 [Leucoagaricus sp. SymC.cos]|nr:hypothetical protein AN958_12438 [Leucoagaricus sp. SymC.cos]